MATSVRTTPTRDDVLTAFTHKRGEGEPMFQHRPATFTEIASVIAMAKGLNWAQPFEHFNRAAFLRLLERMTEDGTLIMFTGEGWKARGVAFYDQRDIARYWTLRERFEEWRTEAQRKQAQAKAALREKASRVWVLERLAERHPEEYRALLEQWHTENPAE